jgi:feruloyl esterase
MTENRGALVTFCGGLAALMVSVTAGTPPLADILPAVETVEAAPVVQTAVAGPAAPGSDAARCAALVATDFGRLAEAPTRVTAARIVDVPSNIAGPLASSPIRQYCQVLGYVAPQNKFELRLPLAAQWNERFHLTACGGFCGALNGEVCNPTLARGYASITTNGGHESGEVFDGVWAANAPALHDDLAWRGIHVVTVAGKAITAAFYARPIARSYMSGCSKGGHAALMEAQRFPQDFDGLLASAPVYDLVGRTLAGAFWAQAVNDGHGGSVLTPEATLAINRSVLARCGAQAGVDEGLVTDPPSCDWRPEMAACAAGREGSDCLSPRQVTAVAKLMSPAVDSRGRTLYAYPHIPGTETDWAGWNFGRGASGGPPANLTLSRNFFSYMSHEAPRSVDPLAIDFDRFPQTLTRARKVYDATSHDLRAFKKRGGKLVIWHGLADGAIMATSTTAYYDGVVRMTGGRAQTEDFFRLFLVPGVHHCAGGPGLTAFDALTLLERWVEKGEAPDVLIASRVVNGVTERSRPIYPYPVLARYSGQGDARQASSFVPFDPTRR